MLYLKIKDIKNRTAFFRSENRQKIYKYIFINIRNKTKSSKTFDILLFNFLQQYSKNNFKLYSKTRLLRRCVMSNRNRSVFRPFGFSRIVLKNFMSFGILPGYKKAVW
jgi:ribosomal protein S14